MKTATLSTRVDQALLARLDRFETGTGIERASLVRAALTAALDCYERQGSLSFPLTIADSAGARSAGTGAAAGTAGPAGRKSGS